MTKNLSRDFSVSSVASRNLWRNAEGAWLTISLMLPLLPELSISDLDRFDLGTTELSSNWALVDEQEIHATLKRAVSSPDVLTAHSLQQEYQDIFRQLFLGKLFDARRKVCPRG
jgi:hypothetical protein